MKAFQLVSPSSQTYADQVFCSHQGFSLEVCRRPESMATAFRLRYRAYLAVDAIPENDEEMLYDDFDFQENSRVHLVWYEGKPVATVRGCIWSDQYGYSPIESVNYFNASIKSTLGLEGKYLESNRYAVDPEFNGRKSLMAQILMFRIHALNSAVHKCSHIMTAVRENHIPFYRRFLNMEPLSDDSFFVSWANAHVYLLTTDRESSLRTALKRGMPEIQEGDIELYAARADLPLPGDISKAA